MIYVFSDCELDTCLYEFRKAGELLKLEPKVFDVLVYLIQYRERVVTKEELLTELIECGLEVLACGMCLTTCSLEEGDLLPGITRGSMKALAAWVKESDNVMTF